MSLGEFDLIARYFARHAARGDVLLGIGDDAAVIATPADRRLVIAMDTIVEGVHFPVGTAAADIGYRALAVNLSDLAAMGAEPAWMTLSLSLPESEAQWVAAFAQGLFELADLHGVALIGGDTVRGPMVITVQVAGYVETDRWLTRSGAKEGDLIFVSGSVGEAAAGLSVIQQSGPGAAASRSLRQRFLRPQPRVELGRHLRMFATAAMDISDGLLTDLDKLCAASNCGAEVDVGALPISAAMREMFDEASCVDYALAGGDDYEIMFTVRPAQVALVPAGCTRIGAITKGKDVRCIRDGLPVTVRRRGYDHFATKDSAP
ncbi:thiamine-monophosphate kinase [Povalibacter uvarum]|uniref:Thiamine-monophosphate kinase n=1 Tax=Povalibacter uvarum TaxID=732238 RepID=A0A841HG46_9GAMM|nr:thiamine-phosphate kinase [Povalibacter uvarum]MBB6091544.1 thiamine-monophosphate kinase [Povalibacter uvarum]